MTKAIKSSELGLAPHYKVRVVIPGAILHLASRDVPEWSSFHGVRADWIEDPDYGDTVVHINWDSVVAVTYRFSP